MEAEVEQAVERLRRETASLTAKARLLYLGQIQRRAGADGEAARRLLAHAPPGELDAPENKSILPVNRK